MFTKHKTKKQLILRIAIIVINLAALSGNLFSQTNRLFFPFLDKESQSNVVVTVWGEQSCPPEFANTLSNTNLFAPEDQALIQEVFEKYKNVTSNSGPSGTVLVNQYKTNFITQIRGGTINTEKWVSTFQHTNSDASEKIMFGAGMLARFRDKAQNGYDVVFTRTGGGTLLTFGRYKHDLPNGLFVRFNDLHAQGSTWDYKLANFNTNSPIEEYRQYTNGLVLGKYLMWNPQNRDLILEADFKEPYDFEGHRIDLRMLQQHSQK